jgi:hypothetical protein
MLSALIPPRRGYPAVRLAAQPVHRRSVRHGPLVLVAAPRKTPAPTIDRDRTVSRRSEPSSRATLMGEQPNPWDLLQPQDVTSRHRGAKPPRRYELLGGSACYPRSTFYPLSDGPSIRYRRITMPQFPACSGCPPPSQAPLCHCTLAGRLPIGPRAPLEASVTLLEATTPVKLPAKQCPRTRRVRLRTAKGPYFNGGSRTAGAARSKPPAYPTHRMTKVNAKL